MPKKGALKFIKQILKNIKREIDSNTKIAGNFNIPSKSVDRSFRKKDQ